VAPQAGVHPQVVQERLGHSTIALTLDIYSHVIPAMQEEGVALIAGLVFAGKRSAPLAASQKCSGITATVQRGIMDVLLEPLHPATRTVRHAYAHRPAALQKKHPHV
jgi:hypothetical protein